MLSNHCRVTIVGMFAGIAVMAIASSVACNTTTVVNCADSTTVAVLSPNCSNGIFYPANVENPGYLVAVTVAQSNGYTSWENGTKCTFTCHIVSDCKGLSPLFEIGGGHYNKKRAPDAQPCP